MITAGCLRIAAWRRLAVVGLAGIGLAVTGSTATADPADDRYSGDPAYLSAAGILPARVHALLVNADTELSGYPAAFAGWRVGLGGFSDLGLEVGGNDVAVLGRLHGKLRMWESANRRWFAGGKLRVEFKRHHQSFPAGIFRAIDDLGFTFVPELSAALRLGAQRRHALFVASFYYLDVDVRRGHDVEHYVLPAMIGYEGRLWRGLHLCAEAGVFFELFQPATAGEPLIKAGLTLAYELR